MKHTRIRNKTLGLALVAALASSPFGLVGPAWASQAAQALHLKYEANWGGVHIADFILSLQTGPEGFENRFRLETRGLTRYFSNLTVRAESTGTLTNGKYGVVYLPSHYRTEYTNSKHFRWVDILFPAPPKPATATTGTSPIKGMEDKWDPKEKGPEILDKVEPKYLTAVSDPLSLVPEMIALVRAHLGGGPKSGVIKGFDGRRRFDLRIDYLGPATRTIADVAHETYRVRVHPIPVAGFKPRHKKFWEGAAFDFYLARDTSLKPMQIVPLKHGPVLTMTAECPQACALPAEDD